MSASPATVTSTATDPSTTLDAVTLTVTEATAAPATVAAPPSLAPTTFAPTGHETFVAEEIDRRVTGRQFALPHRPASGARDVEALLDALDSTLIAAGHGELALAWRAAQAAHTASAASIARRLRLDDVSIAATARVATVGHPPLLAALAEVSDRTNHGALRPAFVAAVLARHECAIGAEIALNWNLDDDAVDAITAPDSRGPLTRWQAVVSLARRATANAGTDPLAGPTGNPFARTLPSREAIARSLAIGLDEVDALAGELVERSAATAPN